MYTLILLTSLHSKFHHDLNVIPVDRFETKTRCLEVGAILAEQVSMLDKDIDTKVVCESTK